MRFEATASLSGDLPYSANSPDVFFSFKSIVIIGASEDVGRIGGTVLFLLKKYGYEGAVYGINSKYEEVQGVRCFPRASDLPDGIELAVFCVSASNLPEMLPTLQRKGLKGAIVFSSGFGESGEEGKALQDWLTDYARDNRIAVLGPNCAGMASFAHGRPLTFSNVVVALPRLEPGRIALLCQSAGVAVNLLSEAASSGVGFSHMVTTGNEADCGAAEFLEYFADDPQTDTVIGYLEGLKDGPAFCRGAAKMQARGKPLILIKVGTSPAGQDAVSSHTGRLSTDDAGFQAAFDRYGVIRVSTLQDLQDFARVFAIKDLKPKITIVTTSGGAGVYVSDLCHELDLPLSVLSPETEARLAEFVPSFGRTRNPVDITAHVNNDISLVEKSLRVLLNDADTGVVVFMLFGKATKEASEEAIALFKKVQATSPNTLVICWLGASEEVRARAAANGLIVFSDPSRFLRPLSHYLRVKEAAARSAGRDEAFVAGAASVPVLEAIEPILEVGSDGQRLLAERSAMAALERAGVDCPQRAFARSTTDIENIARSHSFPVVMKLVDPIVAHKSDVGGVIVDIKDPEGLMRAWNQMVRQLDAREVMVAEQIPKGVELIVGYQRDDTFGARLTIGGGGIWANHINDAITLVPPFSADYIRSVLPRLSVWGALSGARGQPAMAVEPLVQTILGIARVATSLEGVVHEFECNPVIATRERAVAVDAIGYARPTIPSGSPS